MESMSPIPACESLTVAFLRECPSDNACLLQTLVALANTAGGDLYLGVDNDGTVIGLTDPSAVEALLIAAVRDRISPSLVGSFAAVPMTVSGKAILRVHIDAGPMKPYSLDPPSASGIYVREGCTNRLASLANITRLVRANNPVSYEDRAAFNQDLTFDACTAFCHERHRAINVKNATFGFGTTAGRPSPTSPFSAPTKARRAASCFITLTTREPSFWRLKKSQAPSFSFSTVRPLFSPVAAASIPNPFKRRLSCCSCIGTTASRQLASSA